MDDAALERRLALLVADTRMSVQKTARLIEVSSEACALLRASCVENEECVVRSKQVIAETHWLLNRRLWYEC